MQGPELRQALAQYYGCEQPFRSPLHPKVLYTDGFKCFLANAGNGAYWLLDILGTQPEIHAGVAAHGMCVVVLHVVGSQAKLTVARDYRSPEKDEDTRIGTFSEIAYEREIDYTDCPEGVWKFYFIGNMLMLPSEY
jgi:hypothetical protein